MANASARPVELLAPAEFVAPARQRPWPWPWQLLRSALGSLRRILPSDRRVVAAASTADSGRVTLVGVGPGDPELLTLKALRTLQTADVLLVDDLVPDDILALAPATTARISVGKRGDGPSCAQADINALMVALARQGRHVARVKSGDPMVFGRAGEEIAALREAGVPVSVVPGVTTALALGATLGVSLSRRGLSQHVILATGSDRDGGLPRQLDWAAMARPHATSVIYMGARTASGIAARLRAEGLASDTPVVMAFDVSRPGERVWTGTLDDLADGPPARTGAPAILGIGAVFAAATAVTGAIADGSGAGAGGALQRLP